MKLKDGFRDPATVADVARRIRNYDFIDDVRFGEEWVQKLYRIRNIATLAGLALGLTFAGVAVIIIKVDDPHGGARAIARSLDQARRGSDRRIHSQSVSDRGPPEGHARRAARAPAHLARELADRKVRIQLRDFGAKYALAGIAAGALGGLLGSAFSVGRHLKEV